MRVGIIGAGAAGLTAAYDLGKMGHEAVVYERAPFVGGQASTFDVGGARLERGYHHWFTNDTDIIELVQEIGLGGQIRWIASTVGTLYDGKIYRFVTPLDLLKFKPLSMVDRIRMGLVTLYLQRQKSWRKYEGITADEWLRRHAGKGPYEAFWGPMLRGKFGDKFFDKVGMPWVWSKIQTRVASRGKGMVKEVLGYPIGSFGEVFDVLTDKVRELGGQVHISASVDRIVIEDGKVSGLEVSTGQGGKETTPEQSSNQGADEPKKLEKFDAVIATTPSYIFPKLVPELPEDYLAKLTGLDYLSAVLIILELDRSLSPVYWLNVADRSIPFVGVIEHTRLIGPEHYGGKHIVYLSNYLSKDHPMYEMGHEELLKAYEPHLRKINPDFDPSWISKSYHYRVDAAQPIIGTNYSSRMPSHRTPFSGLYLANTTQIYPEDRGTNYSVRMGRQLARMVAEDIS